MFGFGNSQYKKLAAHQVGTCIVFADLNAGLTSLEDPQLKQVADEMWSRGAESWVRRIAVASLVHNLQLILTQYIAQNPARIQKEYKPILDLIMQMLPNHPKLGPLALSDFKNLFSYVDRFGQAEAFPRHGWGRWVISSQKAGLPHEQTAVCPLSPAETDLAFAIDDIITGPFRPQCNSIYGE